MKKLKAHGDLLHTAAIVCSHVATGQRKILVADRGAPEDPADSGWQFLCGAEIEDWEQASVWSVQEVIDVEPTLASLVNMSIGTRLMRLSQNDEWVELPGESETH